MEYLDKSFLSIKSSSLLIMESNMGTIIMAVAVLEIHIERKAVANIKPSKMRAGLVPVIMRIRKAIRLCKFHFCMASATRKPPIKRKIT